MKHGERNKVAAAIVFLSFRVKDSPCPDLLRDSLGLQATTSARSTSYLHHRLYIEGDPADCSLTPPLTHSHTLLVPKQQRSFTVLHLLSARPISLQCRRSALQPYRALASLQSWTCRLPVAPQPTDHHAVFSFHFAAKAGPSRHPRLPGRHRIPLLITLISRIPSQIRWIQPQVQQRDRSLIQRPC